MAAIAGIASGALGAVGSTLGAMFDPGNGAGFKSSAANVVNPTNPSEIAASQNQANLGLAQQQGGITQQQAFLNALSAQNGIGNQSSVYNQLQGVANGTGPNPAQAQLAQATGANVANQAALMAGQRGSSANAGLIARQAAQQGAAIQQNAAGQAATMQAGQSLGALNQLGGISGQQVSQQGSANQALINNQNAIAQNALTNQSQQYGAQQATNNNNVGMQSNQNSVNGQIANTNAGGMWNVLGKTAGAAGQAAMMAEGGEVDSDHGPKSFVGRHFKGLPQKMASGGSVPALVSPGERYLPPKAVQEVASGKKAPMSAGEKIPGKPAVGGAQNSYANDTVHKKLQEGGIVLPRSVTQAKDPDKAAVEFIAAVMAKHGKGLK